MSSFQINELTIADALDRVDGAMLPERVLQDTLKVGFAKVKEDQTLIKELFYKMPERTLKDIMEFFAAHDVTVRQGLPIGEDPVFPIVAITNAADNEDQSADLMGSFMAEGLDISRLENSQILGHPLKSEYQVWCLGGKDSNAPLFLYYLAKAILTVNHLTLDAAGLHNVMFSGRDVTLREDIFPSTTFSRVLTVTCGNYFAVRVTERVGKALQVNTFTELPFSDTKKLLEDA